MYKYKALFDTVIRVPHGKAYKDVELRAGEFYDSPVLFDATARHVELIKSVGPEAPVVKSQTKKRSYSRKA